jgi:acyl phosphate:glycerol-3-phosphate acyltransferase
MLISWLPILIGYLLGGIPFGLVIARLWGIEDIRRHGSGNIGATNVWRIAGWKAGLLVFVFDIGKGVLAVLIAKLWTQHISNTALDTDVWLSLCGLSAILGHIFPIFLGFRGGKGVNTALGVMIMLLPLESGVAAVVFILMLLASRYVSLSSIIASLSFAGFTCYEKFADQKEISGFLVGLSVGIACVIIATHRKNISRMISGTENRIHFRSHDKKKQPKVASHV